MTLRTRVGGGGYAVVSRGLIRLYDWSVDHRWRVTHNPANVSNIQQAGSALVVTTVNNQPEGILAPPVDDLPSVLIDDNVTLQGAFNFAGHGVGLFSAAGLRLLRADGTTPIVCYAGHLSTGTRVKHIGDGASTLDGPVQAGAHDYDTFTQKFAMNVISRRQRCWMPNGLQTDFVPPNFARAQYAPAITAQSSICTIDNILWMRGDNDIRALNVRTGHQVRVTAGPVGAFTLDSGWLNPVGGIVTVDCGAAFFPLVDVVIEIRHAVSLATVFRHATPAAYSGLTVAWT